jgi:hypothetical protein
MIHAARESMMIRTFAGRVRLVWLGCIGLSFALSGCGSSQKAYGEDEGLKNMQRLSQLLNLHRVKNMGRLPASDEAFKQFLKTVKPEELQNFGITVDVDSCLVSPRDKKPYVINYKAVAGTPPPPTKPGERPTAGLGGRQLLAWEQEGSGGKRYVLYAEGGSVVLMTDAEFNEGAPK